MKVSEVLTQARAAIVEKGWTQGAYMKDADGFSVYETQRETACAFCLLGAVKYVVPETVPNWRSARSTAKMRLMFALNDLYVDTHPAGLPHLSAWNDASDRTKQDVVQSLTTRKRARLTQAELYMMLALKTLKG